MGVEVENLNKLVRSLVAAGVEISDLRSAFSAISKKAEDLAVKFAPRKTGALRKSIRGSTKTKNKAVVRAGGARTKYAPIQEYGNPHHSIRPQRYLGRADDAIRPEVPKLIEQNLRDIIERNGLDV